MAKKHNAIYNKKSMKKDKLLKNILLIFIMLQPIFDLSFFYGQVATLIRLLIILAMFIIVILMDKSKLKKYLFIYLITVIIYFIFHHLNALNFTSLVPGNFNYSVIDEILYIIKMLMSVLIIYLVYTLEIGINNLNKPINIAVLLISGSIVLLNFLTLSYSSYSFDTISGNFFTWFTNHNYLFDDLSSKGYFEFANQIVAILILYLPIIIYFYFKNFKPLNIITLFIMLLSLLMLGTRISIYGGLLVLIFCILLYLLLVLLKKEKFNLKIFSLIIIFIILFVFLINYSPVKLKQNYYEDIYETDNQSQIKTVETKETPKEEINKLDYILNNYEDKLIFEEFILYSYPYQYDPDFWINIMNEDVTKRVDTRYLEIEMVKRVVSINNNKLDNFLGITYSRVMNIFNIERDYIMQYYSLGIIGTILLIGPYFAIVIICLIKVLKDYQTKFNFKNLLLLSSVSILLFSAYFSGNILNGPGCIIPLSFICGVLLKEVWYDKIR